MRLYTARGIASLGLPGLTKPRLVRLRAAAELWPYETRPGRGGPCRWYPVASLPADVRAGIEAQATAAPRDLAPAQLAEARERLEACARIDRALSAGVTVNDALASLAGVASDRTLRRWWDRVRELPRTEWLSALGPDWKGGRPSSDCDERVFAFFRDDYLRGSKPSYRAVYRRTVKAAEQRGWSPVPSLKVLRSRLEREVPFETRVLKREGADVLSRCYPAQERDRSRLRALEAVNADGHRFDVLVRWPDEKVERPILLAFQDLASNKIVGWRLDRTENADLVRLAFADVVTDYGVPEHVYLDNGRAFAARAISGGTTTRFRFPVKSEEPLGIMKAVGVHEIHWCKPFSGQSKPIERGFGDLCESIARHPLCEGAYTGRATTHKPHNYSERAVELADFAMLVGAQIAEHNARPARESSVARGSSFDVTFRALYERGPIQRASDAQRRMCLLAAEKVRVRQGTGCVHLSGNRYWAPELTPLQGHDVVVRFDPDRLHGQVHVYRLDGAYLVAADCQAPVGFNDSTAAREHERKRRAYLKAARLAAKAQQMFTAAELADIHLGGKVPDRLPAPKVLKPIFGASSAPTAERESAPEVPSSSPDLVAELGRAALGSGRLRRRATND